MMERSRSSQDIISILQNQIDALNKRIDILTSRNTYFDDWHYIGGSGQPAFQDSWSNYGSVYDVCAFKKLNNGLVIIKGLMQGGTMSVPSFTLPAGYRPNAFLQIATSSHSAFGLVQVDSSGSFTPIVGDNSYFSVCCSFYADL